VAEEALMLPAINVTTDIKRLTRGLNDTARNQVPFATAKALTASADIARITITRQLPTIFDKPTPFTMRAISVQAASKKNLQARVFVRDSQAEYLHLQETGGTRMPPKTALIMPEGIKLDSYGNMTRSSFRRAKARKDTFIGEVKGIGGLWQRPPRGKQRAGGHGTKGALNVVQGFRTGLTLLLKFIPSAKYKSRFQFRARVVKSVKATLPAAFRDAMRQAMATRRR
jgi:hypothetical protein